MNKTSKSKGLTVFIVSLLYVYLLFYMIIIYFTWPIHFICLFLKNWTFAIYQFDDSVKQQASTEWTCFIDFNVLPHY